MPEDKWRPRKRSERTFYQELLSILQGLTHTKGIQPVQLLSTPQWLDRYAEAAARRMVVGQLVQNARNWKAAAREAMRGRQIYEALQLEMQGPVGDRVRELVAQNALLIKTLPRNVAGQVTEMIARRTLEGKRAVTAEQLIPHVFRVQARRIARTETGKAMTALTQARSENLQIPAYVWRSVLDSRVRKSHRLMDDVIVFWKNPPSPERLIGERNAPAPYNAGNFWNCRCSAEPLLRLDQVAFPHKVYDAGRIQMMSLSRFKQLAHWDELARAA